MDLVIASNNKHKVVEIKDILRGRFDNIYSLNEVGISAQIEETGTTLLENALIKARTIKRLTPHAVLADDTGLCVDALNGAPGVFSARYAGEDCNDGNNRAKLLRALSNADSRKAHFETSMAIILPSGEEITAIGIHNGQIIDKEIGDNGFGYDSVFFSDEMHKTFAQLTLREKDQVSHRSRALHNLLQKL